MATFEHFLVTPEERTRWVTEHSGKYPLLVAELNGRVLGWASLSPYQVRPRIEGIAELLIYIDRDYRRHGVGRELMRAIQAAGRKEGHHKLIGRFVAHNDAGRTLCRMNGWREVGVHRNTRCWKAVGTTWWWRSSSSRKTSARLPAKSVSPRGNPNRSFSERPSLGRKFSTSLALRADYIIARSCGGSAEGGCASNHSQPLPVRNHKLRAAVLLLPAKACPRILSSLFAASASSISTSSAMLLRVR